jgi:hypothetical protein
MNACIILLFVVIVLMLSLGNDRPLRGYQPTKSRPENLTPPHQGSSGRK